MPGIFHFFLLRKALIKHLGEGLADEILPIQLVEGGGVDKAERAERAVRIINEMDRKLSVADVKRVRRSMSCLLTKQQIKVMDEAKEKSVSLERQIEIINRGFSPGQIEMAAGGFNFYFNRPACICRMFSKLDNPCAPASFCECCGGNILRIFKYWLNVDMEIEIRQTFLTSGDNCIFKLVSLN